VVWALLIAIRAVFITDQSAFPAPFALGPVLGTAAVIASGIGTDREYLWPLTNRVAGYEGDFSYSLYLWHFPVIVFATVYLSETPRRLVLVALVLTVPCPSRRTT
jgi:peptidoglycan/LPS O-acetylase OafA/YrhL